MPEKITLRPAVRGNAHILVELPGVEAGSRYCYEYCRHQRISEGGEYATCVMFADKLGNDTSLKGDSRGFLRCPECLEAEKRADQPSGLCSVARCEGCGEYLEEYELGTVFSHTRTEEDRDGNPQPMQCGPVHLLSSKPKVTKEQVGDIGKVLRGYRDGYGYETLAVSRILDILGLEVEG